MLTNSIRNRIQRLKSTARFTEMHTTRERRGVHVKVFFSIGRVAQFKMIRYNKRFRKYCIDVRTCKKRKNKGLRRFR